MRRKTRRKTRRKRKKIRRRKMKKTRRRRYLRRKRRNRRRKIGGGPPWKTTDFHVGERLKWIRIKNWSRANFGGTGIVHLWGVKVIQKDGIIEVPNQPIKRYIALSIPREEVDMKVWVNVGDIVDFERPEPEPEPLRGQRRFRRERIRH